jgi:multidrug efflux system membrane fusion protein
MEIVRMKRFKAWLKWLAPVMVLLIAVLIAGYLEATKPQLKPSESVEREWLVDLVTTSIGDQEYFVKAYGEVIPERDLEMRSLVSGQVIEVSPNFKDGGIIDSGEMLLQIEPFEYVSTMNQAKAELSSARALLKEYKAQLRAEERSADQNKIQLELAIRELNRRKKLLTQKVVSEKHVEDAAILASERERIEGLSTETVRAYAARLERQESVISSAEILLQRTQRDLKNTKLIAPFEGYLTSTSAAVGKRLSINDRVARLLDLKQLEVMFHLPDSEYGKLISSDGGGLEGRIITVVWRFGQQTREFVAAIERVSSEIKSETGAIRVYAQLFTDSESILIRPGTFVEVIMPGPIFPKSVKLPENALHESNSVYVSVGGRLEKRLVDVLGRTGNEIIVRGELSDGDKVVISRFAEIGPGIKVRAE